MVAQNIYVHLNMNGNEIQNVLAQKSSQPPLNPSAGQFYYNTVDNTLYVYNGTEWLDALSQGIVYSEGDGIDITNNVVSIDLATNENAGNITLTKVNGLAANAPIASTSQAGLIEIATDLEASTGTSELLAVNPKQLATKVPKLSTSPVSGTYTKLTINSNGLVTSGTTLLASDIPSLNLSKISDVTATAAEVNVLDGITASTAELNIMDGVTVTTSDINSIVNKIDLTNLSINSDSTSYLGYNNSTGKFSAKVDTVVGTVSTNLITSGAVNTALSNKLDKKPDGTNYLIGTDNKITATYLPELITVTGVKGNAESTYRTGNVNITADNVLPLQANNSGKFLTTNGSTASWATVDALPSQAGYSGKFLTTNGTSASWADAVTSSSVINALGYTPYNSTNPSGYQANVIEVIKVNDTEQTVTNKAVNISVPTDTSDLTNGAGFLVSSDLEGYATESYVNSQGFITGIDSSDVTTALGYTPYNSTNPDGYITGITSSDVTSALGYTPYSSSNPDGYITGITSSDVTNALGYTPYNSTNPDGYITGITSSDVTSALGYTPYNSTNPNGYQANVIETIKVNDVAQTVTSKAVNISVPTQASDIGAVPTSRTVNGKALTTNITLDSTDVGALSSTTTINDLTTTAQQEALNSGANTTNIGQITTNTSNITTINSKIPVQATASNQLADKEFVNSSIATNTANFIGTFENVQSLESYSGTVTNNDYAFVVNHVVTDNGNDWSSFNSLDSYNKALLTNFDYAWVINGSNFDLYRFDIVAQEWDLRASSIAKTDVSLNTAYNRYKASVSGSTVTWDYEYTLNNSSFTAAQWAAINSGITSGDVALIQTALQSGDNISELTNDSGYITGITSSDVTTALGYTPYDSTNPNGYTSNTGTVTSVNNIQPVNGNVTLSIPAAQVQVDWDETDTSSKAYILNKPYIPPEVIVDQTYDSTSSHAQSGVAIAGAGFITGITSSDVTTALGYTPYDSTNPAGYTSNVGTVTSVNNVQPVSGNVTISIPTNTSDLTNDSGFLISSDLTNYVTTNTDQNITGTKTYVGQKKIAFKQNSSSDKLGFTLYNNSGTEKGYLEFNPSNNVDGVPLMTLGNYATAAAGLTHVGFRKYSNISGASGAYNLLAPLISDAKTPFSLTTTYTNFYLPLGFTDGNTVVKTAKSGMVDISSLLPSLADYVTNSSLATTLADYVTNTSLATTLADYALVSSVPTKVSDLVNDSGYITGITSSDVTSALGYTPYDSSNPSGYITGITSSDVTTALGYTPYNSSNPAGYISGITSSDVTTALGYTPYNSSNPSGYITGITSSDVTSALGYTPYNSTNPSGYQANVIETIKVNGTAQTVTSKAVDISVPTDTSDLTNGAGYITGIDSSDVTTALGYTPQAQLVSGTNIKTVNSNSLLGSGDITTPDTKNTAGSTDTSSKIFLVGATSQAANPQTYSHDTVFVDTSGRLNSAAPASNANDTTVATTKWVKDQGYTTNTGTVTSVNSTSPDSNGNVSLTIPTTTSSVTSGSTAALTSGCAYTNLVTSVAAHGTDANKINVTKAGSTTTITINNVATATKATQDASGNTITTTYATKTEMGNVNKDTMRSTEFIVGTQTETTGSWTGVTQDSTLYDGKNISYFLPYAGSGNASLNLTLSGGTTTNAKPVYLNGTSYVTTHFPANSVINLTYNSTKDAWFVSSYRDTNDNTYDRVKNSNNVYAVAACTNGKLIVGTSSGYKDIAASVTFDIDYPVLYCGTAAAATKTTNNTYLTFPGVNLQTTKASWTGTQWSTVYLVGTLSGKTFTIDSNVFTTTVPNTQDNKVYMPIGFLYSTYQTYFTSSRTLYAYVDGSFQQISTKYVQGSGTQPIYFDSNGQPQNTTYTLSKSVPSDAVFTDTKNTAGSTDTSSKIFLIGATSQAANPQTYSHDTVFVDGSGFLNSSNPNANTNNTVVATTKWVTDKGYLTSHQTIKQDGITGATVNRYGSCSTGASTAAKTVSITTGTFNLETGTKVTVKFTNANTADSPTLNVNSKGAKNIFHNGAQITNGSNKALLAGTCDFVYDGTQWQLIGNYINTVPTVNNSTITIQQGGTTVDSFTTNQASNKTINIPKEVFIATYGVTSYSDITTAINAGKLVLCRDTDSSNNDYVYTYRSHTSTSITFYNISSSSSNIVIVDNSNNWTEEDNLFLPSQSGQSGKFLTTNGTNASWGTPTDTKNTAGSTDTSSKIFLVGATSQAANPQTYSHDTAFVDTDGSVNSVTPTAGNSSTKVATTAFVGTALGSYLLKSGGTMTGTLNFANNTWNKMGDNAYIGDHNVGGHICIKPANSNHDNDGGITFFNSSDTNLVQLKASSSTLTSSGALGISNNSAKMQYNSTTEAIEFVFS